MAKIPRSGEMAAAGNQVNTRAGRFVTEQGQQAPLKCAGRYCRRLASHQSTATLTHLLSAATSALEGSVFGDQLSEQESVRRCSPVEGHITPEAGCRRTI